MDIPGRRVAMRCCRIVDYKQGLIPDNSAHAIIRAMRTYYVIIAGLWLILIVYWLVSATRAKRSLGGSWSWGREIALRLILLVLIVLALRLTALNRTRQEVRLMIVNASLPLAIVGIVLCALGVGFAIWARAYLGRNWGMPMTQKEIPALVTTGPYAYVRHPVYAGFLLAMLGSAIGQSLIWVIPFVLFGIYFAYSARREEKLMLAQFPEQYAAYMQRTKMFVPFVW